MGFNLELVQLLSAGIWICNNDSFKTIFYMGHVDHKACICRQWLIMKEQLL